MGTHSTSLQRAKILERSNSLRRRVDAWIDIQHLYVPALASIRLRSDQEGGGKPPAVHDVDLYLPSQIHDTIHCDVLLLRYEWALRYARAHGALNELRGLLLMESMLYKSKDKYSRGQRQQTWSVNTIRRVRERITACAMRYRKIRTALLSLAKPLVEVHWESVLRVLEDDDMKSLTSLDNETAEGRKKLKWIWTVKGTGANADASTQSGMSNEILATKSTDMNYPTALRVEWCKARARAHRWQEECLLLCEEMRRVLAFFTWQAEMWRTSGREYQQKELTSSLSIDVLAMADIQVQDVLRQGKIAYAFRQASIREDMGRTCEAKWKDIYEKLIHMDGFDAAVLIEPHEQGIVEVPSAP